MKITDLQARAVWTSRERSWLFVEVQTDAGIKGFGEASQSRNDAGVIEEIKRLAPQYVGEDPLDLIARRHALLEWPYVGRTLFAAVSGLEQALWDICGKHLQVPVYQLLGGRVRERVRAYANVGYAAASREPDAVAQAAASAAGDGFDAIKVYPFGTRPSDAMSAGDEARWIAHGIAVVRAVRAAVGNEVDVMLDLMHQFRDSKEVRDIVRRLDACNVFWIEDPFVQDHPAQLAELRRAIGSRVAGGAPLLRPDEWRPLLEAGALDVVMPDVKWLGGIRAAQQLGAIADMFGAQVSPHNASGPVATAACVHLSFTLRNFIMLEYAWGVPAWRTELTRGTERIERGYFLAPTAPGLGIDVDMQVAQQHAEPPQSVAAGAGVRLPSH